MTVNRKEYVVYGMKAKCSQGTMENYLTTDVGHGVVYQGQPLLNANDHTPQVNLTHFGDCHARAIFEQAKDQFNEKYKSDGDDGFFEKTGKMIAKTVVNTVISVKEYFGIRKCELDTPIPWEYVNSTHRIDGAPALTAESLCTCRYGGIISVVIEGEEQVNVELELVDAKVAAYENALIEQHGELLELAQQKENGELSDTEILVLRAELKKINIMEVLYSMGDEINEMVAIQNNKNEFINFINLVNSDQPLDLKNRKPINPKTGQEYNFYIWQLPWGDGTGNAISPDYAGNWLYGYMGAEYFTTFAEDELLKFGAGAAQLLSDLKNKTKEQSIREIIDKYIDSMLSGNYGDNENSGGKSDSEMIQEGIDAYRKKNE